jgi:hypothetical protein
VRDNSKQALAYVYFEDEPGRRSAAKLLSKGAKDRRQYREVAGSCCGSHRVLARPAGARRYGASKIPGDNNDMQETAFGVPLLLIAC